MYSSYDAGIMAGAIGIFIIVLLVVIAIILIPSIIFSVLYYKKLGKNGWEAIIPVYNTYCLVEVAGLEKYWFYASLAPFGAALLSGIPVIGSLISMLGSAVTIIVSVAIYYNINKRLGKDKAMTVLALIIPLVYYIMVVVDKNTVFNANLEVNPDGPFEDLVNNIKKMFGKGATNNTNQQNTNPFSNPVVSDQGVNPVNTVVEQPVQTNTDETVVNQSTDNTNNQ